MWACYFHVVLPIFKKYCFLKYIFHDTRTWDWDPPDMVGSFLDLTMIFLRNCDISMAHWNSENDFENSLLYAV